MLFVWARERVESASRYYSQSSCARVSAGQKYPFDRRSYHRLWEVLYERRRRKLCSSLYWVGKCRVQQWELKTNILLEKISWPLESTVTGYNSLIAGSPSKCNNLLPSNTQKSLLHYTEIRQIWISNNNHPLICILLILPWIPPSEFSNLTFKSMTALFSEGIVANDAKIIGWCMYDIWFKLTTIS